MSELIKHECGIAFIRLLKPLEYYAKKYGTAFYALNKMQLLMEKQHNRGQDGAGVVNVKLNMRPGNHYISRIRSNTSTPIKDVFANIYAPFKKMQAKTPERLADVQWMKNNMEFTGEIFLGHLRYGTFGGNNINYLHPVTRENNWKTRSLALAGNFNMTNVDELIQKLVERGQFPVETSDTVTILEKIGYYLDRENEKIYSEYKQKGYSKQDITPYIIEHLDILDILKKASRNWDGGYVIGGIVGHGDAFVMRDPNGIRPAFYYYDDEVVVAASERPVIQTTFNLRIEQIQELSPAHALIVKHDGGISVREFKEEEPKKACSFERIYFSRGTDKSIYHERKELGRLLAPDILKEIDYDLQNSVFSYIPNTAAVSFYGLKSALHDYCNNIKATKIKEANSLDENIVKDILSLEPRIEILAVKDAKLRTFITEDTERDDLVEHVYDVTYGIIKTGEDNIVVVDDSIVRGTTLQKSVIRILDRLAPKKIVIASSAPQVRYPDCYGIDMAKLGDFIAFRATVELLKEHHLEGIIDETYQKCKAQEYLPKEKIINHVRDIYKPFTADRISRKIAQLLTDEDINAEVSIVYNSIENLHQAIPDHIGDWYFTGNYPTPGGNKVVNKSFINYIEGRNERAY